MMDRNTKSETKRTVGAPKGSRDLSRKKQQITNAAEELFLKDGYDKTTMDNITSLANISKGTLYHYFKSKEELLKALRAKFENEVLHRVSQQVDKCAENDWKSKVETWIKASVSAYIELKDLHDLVIYSSNLPYRQTLLDAKITRLLSTIILEGNRARAWDIDDPDWTATIMFYSFRGGCDEAILGMQDVNVLPDKLKSIFFRILNI